MQWLPSLEDLATSHTRYHQDPVTYVSDYDIECERLTPRAPQEEGSDEYARFDQLSSEGAHPEFVRLYEPLGEVAVREGGGELAEGAEGIARDTSAGVGGGAHAYGKPQKYKVRLRTKKGSWTKTFDTYCGIVGGAFFTPGVDVFGAPAEVACAGYGVYKAVEAIIENL